MEVLKHAGYSLRSTDYDQPVPLDSAQLECLIPDKTSINVGAQSQLASA